MQNSRNNLWRQGYVLPESAVDNCSLLSAELPSNDFVIIVSHDCDLANFQEEYLEVIIGKIIEKSDGNFTHAKNARKLHIEFKLNDQSITIELVADKVKLLKHNLLNYQPRTDICLQSKNLNILQRWLAARYRRSAFPDEFNERLKKMSLDKQLSKILSPHGSFIPAIFFDLDKGESVERTIPEDLYELDIIILYTSDEDYEEAEKAALSIKQKIEKAFKEKFQIENQWKYVELKNCSIMSDEALTYRQSTMLKQWRLEHISLKSEPAQSILE